MRLRPMLIAASLAVVPAACTPADIGITGPGAVAAKPEMMPTQDDQSLPQVGVPMGNQPYAPTVLPTTGNSGRYYGY